MLRHRCAVHADERASAARTAGVDRPGDDTFPRPALAAHEHYHRRAFGSDSRDEIGDATKRRRSADERDVGELPAAPVAVPIDLAAELARFESLLDQQH